MEESHEMEVEEKHVPRVVLKFDLNESPDDDEEEEKHFYEVQTNVSASPKRNVEEKPIPTEEAQPNVPASPKRNVEEKPIPTEEAQPNIPASPKRNVEEKPIPTEENQEMELKGGKSTIIRKKRSNEVGQANDSIAAATRPKRTIVKPIRYRD